MTDSTKSDFDEFINHIKSGNIDVVKETFRTEYLEMKDEYEMRPLHHACGYGHIEIVKLLLEHKCNIEVSNKSEMSPLHYSSWYGRIEIFKLLVEHQCNIEVTDNEKMRPLHYACQKGHIEIVKLLLDLKCDIESSNEYGMCPIHYACAYDQMEILILLLEQKCNIDAIDNSEMSPGHYACLYGRIEIIKLLFQNKCNFETSDNLGMRPFHYACQRGNLELVKLLFEQQCNSDVSDNDGVRPIHLACQYGHVEIVKLLLQKNCIMGASDNKRMQPIHYACQYGRREIVKLLLENTCDIEDCYDDLLSISQKAKSPEIILLLNEWRQRKLMCSLALVMSLECENGCSHNSCFTYTPSAKNLRKNASRVGSGAFGKIYQCSKFKHNFAIKIIKRYSSLELQKEARDIENDINNYRHVIRHDNIVEYFGAIAETHRLVIFMEFVRGGTLEAEIKRYGTLPVSTIAKYTRQILSGISHLHQNKIIHRDIKSTNILLDSDNELIKLCDFGISRSLMTISTITTQKANTFCGTANYTAPEVINEEPYYYPADIWSVGITVIEMLTGNPPFYKLHPFAVIKKISNLTTFDLKPFEPMSNDLKLFVNHMLQCDPSKRAKAKELMEYAFLNTE